MTFKLTFNLTHDMLVQLSCLNNFSYKDMQILFGLISHTGVVCPAISAPDNGQLSLTNGVVFGSRASYSCNQGYDLVNGASIRSCRANGVWSSVAPTCPRTLLI